MTNLSVLQRNVIHALDCDYAERAFLRACDLAPVLTAERFAYEVRLLVRFLKPYIADESLMKFILDRHWFWRFPKAKAA